MVLKKGWPGTLPEMSLATDRWPRGQILHAFPEAHPLAMGRWGAVACPGGRECPLAPRQRIKCSLAGIRAPLSPPPRCLASSRKNSPAGGAGQLGSPGQGPSASVRLPAAHPAR